MPASSAHGEVCEESNLTDPEIISLCQQIIESQTEEINQMKQILERYLRSP